METTGQIESHLCIGLLLYLKLARVDVGNIRKKGENMEGINTWNIFTRWFFKQTLSIYVRDVNFTHVNNVELRIFFWP